MRTIFVALLALGCFSVHAQILPAEGDTINYLIAGFSVPKNKDAVKYVFKVAEGNYSMADADEFAKHIIAQSKPGSNKQILELPAFGKEYTWAVSYTDKLNKVHAPVVYYHFRTGYMKYTDTTLYRLRILKADGTHGDAYAIPDKVGVAYNMKGVPVWYFKNANKSVTDLKPTSTGTFTYLDQNGAYEIDYNGDILWKAPDNGKVNGENTEHYHHQLTKLNNGNYMVMGHETVLRQYEDSYIPPDSLIGKLILNNGIWYGKVDAGTLIEYDSRGNVVWSWKAASEYTNDTYFGKPYWKEALRENTGMNAFYFDEKKKCIYISFANLNNIVKIEYPSAVLAAVYGKSGNAERQNVGRFVFRNQHDLHVTDKGSVYVFNNNILPDNSTLSVLFESQDKIQNLRKYWEFPCVLDSSTTILRVNEGGSIHVFTDSTILAGTGTSSRMFMGRYA
jgi:hypothetical protein